MELEFNKPFDIEYIKRTEPFSMIHNHHHQIYEIYYLLSGERYYFIKDRTYHIQQGDIVFIPENILHKTSLCNQPEHERILINFKSDFLLHDPEDETTQLITHFLDETHVLRLHPLEQIQVEAWLKDMVQENASQPYATLMIRALFTQLLVFTARLALEQQRTTSEYIKPLHKRIYEVVDYINQHYTRPLSLDELAEHFHLSSFYLSRTFKEVTGFTFVEYINAVRIKEAQALLRHTDMKIIDIAESTGFESISHFGRVFKQISNVSPRHYRNLQARNEQKQ